MNFESKEITAQKEQIRANSTSGEKSFILSMKIRGTARLEGSRQYCWNARIDFQVFVSSARFRRRTFHELNLIRIKADPNYLDRLN